MTYQDQMSEYYPVRFSKLGWAHLVAVMPLCMISKFLEAINEQIEVIQDQEPITSTSLLQRPETLPKCKAQEAKSVLFLEYLWKTAETNLAQENTT